MSLFSGFTSTAPAAAGTASQANPMGSSLIMILIFGVFIYFLLWRPQSKRQKQHRDLLANLKKDDEVLTTGGIAGKIAKMEDIFIHLQIAENVTVKIQKNAIAAVLPNGTLKL